MLSSQIQVLLFVKPNASKNEDIFQGLVLLLSVAAFSGGAALCI